MSGHPDSPVGTAIEPAQGHARLRIRRRGRELSVAVIATHEGGVNTLWLAELDSADARRIGYELDRLGGDLDIEA